MVAIWLQKLLEKIKLRRMSGILPQHLDSIVRYRANIKIGTSAGVMSGGLYYLYSTFDSRHYLRCLLLFILFGLFEFLLPVY